MSTEYHALGAQYKANMPQQSDRYAAFVAATYLGDNMGRSVTITVKDADGADVPLTMDEDAFVAFCTGFIPL